MAGWFFRGLIRGFIRRLIRGLIRGWIRGLTTVWSASSASSSAASSSSSGRASGAGTVADLDPEDVNAEFGDVDLYVDRPERDATPALQDGRLAISLRTTHLSRTMEHIPCRYSNHIAAKREEINHKTYNQRRTWPRKHNDRHNSWLITPRCRCSNNSTLCIKTG